jgi:hypothetical protein
MRRYIATTTLVPFWHNAPQVVYEGESWRDAVRAIFASLEGAPRGGQGHIARSDEPHLMIDTFDRDLHRNDGRVTKREGQIDVPATVYIRQEG